MQWVPINGDFTVPPTHPVIPPVRRLELRDRSRINEARPCEGSGLVRTVGTFQWQKWRRMVGEPSNMLGKSAKTKGLTIKHGRLTIKNGGFHHQTEKYRGDCINEKWNSTACLMGRNWVWIKN